MDQRTIYVGNVTSTVDESAMRSVFDNCGTVTNVRIAGKPNYHTFFCFVEFSDARAAKTALAMDGLLVGDRNIRVSLAKSNPTAVGGGGAGVGSRPSSARPAAAAYTPPQYPGYPPAAYAPPPAGYSPYAPPQYPGYAPLPGYPPAGYPPYGPAHHYPPTHAPTPVTSRHAAVASYANSAARKRTSEQKDPERVARTVMVEHLAAGYDEQAIAQYFDAVGRVTAVRIDKAPDKSGTPRVWVEFETQAAAHDACELSGQEVYGTAIRVQPSKSAIHSNGLLRGDRPPGTEGATAGMPVTPALASPSIPSPAAVAQHLAQAQHAMRPRPAGSTSSSERVADMDEAPPGTTSAVEAESESRRMGAAALMQHEWQPAGGAPPPEAAPAIESAPHPDPAQNGAADAGDAGAMHEEVAAAADAGADVAASREDGADHDGEGAAGHAGTNGFADGHAPDEEDDGALAKRAPDDTALDGEQAVKRTKVL